MSTKDDSTELTKGDKKKGKPKGTPEGSVDAAEESDDQRDKKKVKKKGTPEGTPKGISPGAATPGAASADTSNDKGSSKLDAAAAGLDMLKAKTKTLPEVKKEAAKESVDAAEESDETISSSEGTCSYNDISISPKRSLSDQDLTKWRNSVVAYGTGCHTNGLVRKHRACRFSTPVRHVTPMARNAADTANPKNYSVETFLYFSKCSTAVCGDAGSWVVSQVICASDDGPYVTVRDWGEDAMDCQKMQRPYNTAACANSDKEIQNLKNGLDVALFGSMITGGGFRDADDIREPAALSEDDLKRWGIMDVVGMTPSLQDPNCQRAPCALRTWNESERKRSWPLPKLMDKALQAGAPGT